MKNPFNLHTSWKSEGIGSSAVSELERERTLSHSIFDRPSNIAHGHDGLIQKQKFMYKGKEMTFFLKIFSKGVNGKNANKNLAKTFYRNYGELKKRCIPTFTTYRISTTENKVLMSDLSEGGRLKVVSTNRGSVLLDVSKDDRIVIVKKMSEFYADAAMKGVYFDDSAVFIRLDNENRLVDILAGDFGKVVFETADDDSKSEGKAMAFTAFYIIQDRNFNGKNDLSYNEISRIIEAM